MQVWAFRFVSCLLPHMQMETWSKPSGGSKWKSNENEMMKPLFNFQLIGGNFKATRPAGFNLDGRLYIF